MNKLILILLFLSTNVWADYYDWKLIGKTPNSHTSLKTVTDKYGNKIITDGSDWAANARDYRAPVNHERIPTNQTSSPSGDSGQSQNLVGQAVRAFNRGTIGDIVYGKLLLRAAKVQNGTNNEDQNIGYQYHTNPPLEDNYTAPSSEYNYNDTSSKYKYKSFTGQKYKYDLTNPGDAVRYSVDPAAQMQDSINPMIDLDRNMGQYGGGIK